MLFLLSFFQSYLICGANLLRLVIWSLWFYVSFWFCTWHYIDLRSPFFWFCYIIVGNIFIKFNSLRRYRAVNCTDWFFFIFMNLVFWITTFSTCLILWFRKVFCSILYPLIILIFFAFYPIHSFSQLLFYEFGVLEDNFFILLVILYGE